MPNAQQGTGRDRWREREKAVDKSQKGNDRALAEPSKRRQHSGICGRKPRLPVVRPSPVDKSGWAATLAANDHRPSPPHLGSIESWCNADPPTPRWHTPLTLVATRPCVGRPAPPQIASLYSYVLGLAPSTVRAMAFFAAELLRTIRETAVCKPASSARPTVEPGAVAEETCRCWQEEVGDLTRKRTNVCSCLHTAVARPRTSSTLQTDLVLQSQLPFLSLRLQSHHCPDLVAASVAPPSPPTLPDITSELAASACNDSGGTSSDVTIETKRLILMPCYD
ncbi:uncharacterized protein TRIVIDRAFT_217723 [Trichoderma virens Gv29-8]|uniref:Uncharacterized protein n=1 Tax=Hypocrea virens (strain Gv29-8 / FGSC 10586) TaxID=413071 RepID=G9MFG2_HYPVG|nr:uncharacterized protein TRIVIDRAFT_217723 [Trichoderma virens Gv29-8]EHK27128.1 hypothetical protein TRIVIDRAFT_217723 [Trichoderma virens Gv29-8]UKZ57582.1 hypothetical protein TrVGV298_011442 [Trichoderma virens]